MLSQPSLAWLQWNPSREAFTLPFFDLSIAWYGIIFAAGFVAGYFLLVPLFRTFIYRRNTLYPRDIANWELLAAQFRNIPEALSQLQKAMRSELEALKTGSTPSNALKDAILASLGNRFDRKSLEQQFPGSIVAARTLGIQFADTLTWYIVIGTVIGARLGHVFFYDWPYMRQHPLEILMIRNGGLASHGGTIGILLSLSLFLYWNRKKYPDLTFITLVDLLCIPTAFVAACIRIGNFFNQEIVGVQTNVPWAVIFEDPADGSAPLPRHPVQLYEAVAYLATFFVLLLLWKKRPHLKVGTLSGIFFILVFGSRFFIEFLKMPQSMFLEESTLQTGQYLSLPFILLGIFLLAINNRKKGACIT